MKTTKMFMLGLAAALFAGSLQSCDKTPTEFIADDSSFGGFSSWELASTHQGADPTLGAAHAGNDSTVTRMVYFQDGATAEDGEYPVGTIIVKHSSNPAGSVAEYTAMVKRGNDFNTANADWEWFMLNSDGTIATDTDGSAMRGANLMNGMCGNCHGVASTDYVFSK